MKKLLSGNQAIARGLYEGGVKVVSSYPGTPSTEITEEVCSYENVYAEWAPNEKVGMESAFGASLSGARSATCMKHVGLNVAADPLFTISYTGVNAGLVIVVGDDPGMHSSQNEQDSRHYAIGSKVLMLEPSDSQEAKDFARRAFELSEQFDTPVILRTCTRISHGRGLVEENEREEKPHPYEKNIAKYVMAPANAIRRHPLVEERLIKETLFAESSDLNRAEEGRDLSIGIITAGTSYQYVKEVFGDRYPVLKLGIVNPLPVTKIKEFAEKVERVVIVEELDPVIETHVRNLGIPCDGKNLLPLTGEFSPAILRKAFQLPEIPVYAEKAVPNRPAILCPGCPHRGLFYVFHKLRLHVLGDIGCYTLGAMPPLNALELCLDMGASVSGLHGFLKGNPEAYRDTVAVIGDSTFMHSGMTGLANIAYNHSPATVVIADNSITGMTGHQNNPTNGKNIKGEPATQINLEALCHALGIERVFVVDPYDLKGTEEVIRREIAMPEPSVIISRCPCVLLKDVKPKAPFQVQTDLCKSCKACMALGCPAISWQDSHPHVDTTLCTGCGICETVCPFDAIQRGGRL